MPFPGTKRIKQLVVVVFVVAALVAVLSTTMSPDTSVAAQRRAATVQRTTVDDCDFLKDPEQFRGARERHRLAVSRTTVAVRDEHARGQRHRSSK